MLILRLRIWIGRLAGSGSAPAQTPERSVDDELASDQVGQHRRLGGCRCKNGSKPRRR